MRRAWRWFSKNFEVLLRRSMFLLFGILLVIDVVGSIASREPPRTFAIAEAAFLSLAVLSGLCFGYASLLPEASDKRVSLVEAGERLFASIIPVVMAAALEFVLRLYIEQPFMGWTWTSFASLWLLIGLGTALFALTLWLAYGGVKILFAVLLRDRLWRKGG